MTDDQVVMISEAIRDVGFSHPKFAEAGSIADALFAISDSIDEHTQAIYSLRMAIAHPKDEEQE